jgi:mono/diheme cytochrome c family protein
MIKIFSKIAVCLLVGTGFSASPYVERGGSPLYTEFLDTEFPFIEATVDMRGLAPAGTEENLVPRAVILPLEHDVYVCFDTELLRVAGIWQGGFITPRGLAMLSYDVPLKKMGSGQKDLPKPIGEVAFSTGLYPGWQRPENYAFEDPRSKWVDENELGRGPLDSSIGEWLGMEDLGSAAELRYTLFGGEARERFAARMVDGEVMVTRSIRFDGVEGKVSLIASDLGKEERKNSTSKKNLDLFKERYSVYEFEGLSSLALDYEIGEGVVSLKGETSGDAHGFDVASKSSAHWPITAASTIEMGKPQGSYAVDEAVIPYPNPWERRIRPVSIDFLPNGDAFVLTFDGDVYRVTGLGSADNSMTWRRIAAGFNEPQTLRIRGDELFVFSRLGVTRLVDRDGDGETDFYEMFCNRFTQSADTRDYPLSLALRPNGSFVVSKGGQQNTADSPHSGRALSISADGEDVDFFAFGLRNGYLSGHPTRDLITASDQQGNWVPSTPFHIVRPDRFLGYEPGAPAKEAETQSPALWIPHRVAQSGIEQVWVTDKRMGALAGSILYIEYKKPSLFRIYADETDRLIQTGGTQLPVEFETPLLKGAMNPSDGRPYFVGFQIWDSTAKRLEGLCRLRVIDEVDGLPESIEVLRDGVRLTFSGKLDPEKALNPANYQASSWEYVRTPDYGSAQYKTGGVPGVDPWFVHSVLMSEDRRSVFLAIDGVRETMQLEVQYNLFDKWTPVYFTVNEIRYEKLSKHGFQNVNFKKLFASEPMPREIVAEQSIVSIVRGQELYVQMGCVGCHSTDGTTEGRSGPTWFRAFKSKRTLEDGSTVKVDEEYLRTSILDPAAVITKGYDGAEAGMPSYSGILKDEDVESLVMFIRSLR